MTKENAVANFLDSQDFYELMQAYRHEPIDAATPFEAVRLALYAAIAQPVALKDQDSGWAHDLLLTNPETGRTHLQQVVVHFDAAQPTERNFCETCGQRLGDADHIHTCTPPVAHGKRHPLTAAEIAVLISNVCDTDDQSLVEFVREVEAAHGIKA